MNIRRQVSKGDNSADVAIHVFAFVDVRGSSLGQARGPYLLLLLALSFVQPCTTQIYTKAIIPYLLVQMLMPAGSKLNVRLHGRWLRVQKKIMMSKAKGLNSIIMLVLRKLCVGPKYT